VVVLKQEKKKEKEKEERALMKAVSALNMYHWNSR
jgi:hypothetical protein